MATSDSYSRSSSTSSQGGTASSYSQAVFTVSILKREIKTERDTQRVVLSIIPAL